MLRRGHAHPDLEWRSRRWYEKERRAGLNRISRCCCELHVSLMGRIKRTTQQHNVPRER